MSAANQTCIVVPRTITQSNGQYLTAARDSQWGAGPDWGLASWDDLTGPMYSIAHSCFRERLRGQLQELSEAHACSRVESVAARRMFKFVLNASRHRRG